MHQGVEIFTSVTFWILIKSLHLPWSYKAAVLSCKKEKEAKLDLN